ncbi:MAG: efflux RND transporter periplasmic adaptor subunit [Alphaproteobacteria bacterium]|nr:efflux RND transporter periplasmic adaptor subunit [Alphaproteobacteria bacterium]
MRPWYIQPAILLSCCAFVLGMYPDIADAQQKRAPRPPPSVVVETVQEKDVSQAFTFIGRVEAENSVDIRARVQGVLETRNFTDGQTVEKGQQLFTIEKPPYEVVVAQRNAELASARAAEVNAAADFRRKKALVGRSVVSGAKVDESRANLASAKADVLKAKAALRAAQLDLGYTNIKSPLKGRISRARYSVGNLVGSDSEPLATVTSVDPIHVTIGVSEKQLIDSRKRGIDMKNPTFEPTIVLSDGSPYGARGRFDYLAPTVDQTTDTVVIRAIFPNPTGVLLPGQFVTVLVHPKEKKRAVSIPQTAIQQDRQGYFVLVLDRENRVSVRRVQTVRQSGSDWVIKSGLATGERIIVEGIQKVRPKMVVNPVAPAKG